MAFVFEEVMAADVGKVGEIVEWLGDTGASRHVCNDLSLMQDVWTREKPTLLRHLVDDIHVYTTGTVQLECPNDSGRSTVVSLLCEGGCNMLGYSSVGVSVVPCV